MHPFPGTSPMLAASAEAVLDSLLDRIQVDISAAVEVALCGQWFEQEPAGDRAQFHLLIEGQCWVRLAGRDSSLRLLAGDLVLFPTGARHTLASAPTNESEAAIATEVVMLCGELSFADSKVSAPLLSLLPSIMVIRAHESGEAIGHLGAALRETIATGQHRMQAIQRRMAESLFAIVVCDFVTRHPEQAGPLGALVLDVRLSRVLSAIHAEPGRDWNLESMSQQAGLSRSAFAHLFTERMGVPPIAYLTRLRANEAHRLLAEGRLSVAAVADMMGYRSEAAFRRFFKRIAGVGPGEVRRVAPRRLAEGRPTDPAGCN